ncbi:MAG: hypothetical protein JWO15_3834 [Sphingomonadales bacterium]|nr:hypothetical protein [Sphingomonadales bacterium]
MTVADVNVAAGAIGSPVLTLAAGVVTTVAFAEDLQSVEVISSGTSPVWWTCDGSTPSDGVGYYVPTLGVDERTPQRKAADGAQHFTVVKLFSLGTPTVRVQRG